MIAVPAARFLADFGATAAGAADMPRPARSRQAADEADAAAKLDEAFVRGVEAGRAEASAELEAKLKEQRDQAAKQLAAERQAWAAVTGKKLANTLHAGLQEIETRLADAAARTLKPFVAEELRAQAVAELKSGLDALVTMEQGIGIHISGPADILEIIRGRFAGKNSAITFTESEDSEVRVVAGQATLETRLGEWMAKLNETVR